MVTLMTKQRVTLKIKKIGIISLISTLISISSLSVIADATPQFKRISGNNRYETSKAVSQNGWSQSQCAIICSGENYPDALGASVLAKKYNAPILLSEAGTLDSNSLSELQRLKVNQVFIVGGNGALNDNVSSSIENLGIRVTRIYGADRYDTSAQTAEQIGVKNGIILATGEDYADALSVSPIASKLQMPIILASKDYISKTSLDIIKDKNVPVTYIIGDTNMISDNVANQFPNAKRIIGNDKYERNINILNTFSSQLNFDNVYLATGDSFADALSGSALAGKNGNPIILINKNSINNSVKNYLSGKTIGNVNVLGGIGALSDSIISDILSNATVTNTTGSAATVDNTSTNINDILNNTANSSTSTDNTTSGSSGTEIIGTWTMTNGMKVQLNKVEQDSDSLRLYVTYINDSDSKMMTGDCLAKVVCNGTQYKYDSDFNFNRYYKKSVDHADNFIEPTVKQKSVIFFKPISGITKINIVLNVNFNDFSFNDVIVNTTNNVNTNNDISFIDTEKLAKFYNDIGTNNANIIKSVYSMFNPKYCIINYKNNSKGMIIAKDTTNKWMDRYGFQFEFFDNGQIGVNVFNISGLSDGQSLQTMVSKAMELYGAKGSSLGNQIISDYSEADKYVQSNNQSLYNDATNKVDKTYYSKMEWVNKDTVLNELSMNKGIIQLNVISLAKPE